MADLDERARVDVDGSGLNPAQMWHYFRRYPYILAKVALWVLAIAGIFVIVRSVEAVLFPLLVALLIAYLLDPSVDWFEERGISRTVAILLFLSAGILFAALFLLILYPTIATQAANVVSKLPTLVSMVQEELIPWLESTLGVQMPANASAAMNEYGETVKEQLPTVANKVSTWVGGVLAKTGPIIASLLNIVMIPVFTFYFLRDFDKMRLATVDYIPPKRLEVFLDRVRKADEVVGAWFRGQVEVAGILAVCYAVGLGALFGLIGVGTLSGVAIGILTGLLNIIPYFGVLIGAVLSFLIVLIDWHGVGPVAGVGAVFLVVQLLEGYVITPKIVGEKVGLSPVVVIIVLLLGGELFGLIGVLLAIPVAGVIRVLLPDIIAYYKSSPFFTGELAYDLEQVAVPVAAEEAANANDPALETPADVASAEPRDGEDSATALDSESAEDDDTSSEDDGDTKKDDDESESDPKRESDSSD